MKLYAARSQLPATASVSYTPPAGGEPWVFNVVLEVGNASRRSAAIELTAGNLERLCGLLSLEIAGLAVATSQQGCVQTIVWQVLTEKVHAKPSSFVNLSVLHLPCAKMLTVQVHGN